MFPSRKDIKRIIYSLTWELKSSEHFIFVLQQLLPFRCSNILCSERDPEIDTHNARLSRVVVVVIEN